MSTLDENAKGRRVLLVIAGVLLLGGTAAWAAYTSSPEYAARQDEQARWDAVKEDGDEWSAKSALEDCLDGDKARCAEWESWAAANPDKAVTAAQEVHRARASVRSLEDMGAETAVKHCRLNAAPEPCARWESFKKEHPERAAAIERRLPAD